MNTFYSSTNSFSLFSQMIFALFFLIFSNAHAQSESAVQENWQELCPAQRFCFNYPANVSVIPVQAIDSVAGQLKGAGLFIRYDLGRYSTNYSELVANARIEKTTIDGYAADILITDQLIALRIPKLALGNRFAMSIRFTGAVSKELSLAIFKSIRFKMTD